MYAPFISNMNYSELEPEYPNYELKHNSDILYKNIITNNSINSNNSNNANNPNNINNSRKIPLGNEVTTDIPLYENKELYNTIQQIGYPDIISPYKGGIAIWSHSSMKNNGYPFIKRLEILDEKIMVSYPQVHNSNVYAWIIIDISPEKLEQLFKLKLYLMYDQKKKLLIIRSFSLNSIVTITELLYLYIKNKIGLYDIVENDLINKYYNSYNDINLCNKFRKNLVKML